MTAHSAERAPASPPSGGEKRARILDAAEQVFAKHGFFAAKVADIAREAGVADGTIYLYFKSKDDLLISLFESRMERVNQLLADGLAGITSPLEKLRAFVRTYLTLVSQQPSVAEVLTVELRQSSKFMKSYANPRFTELLRLLASIVTAGQRAGELDKTLPAPMVARMIFGILDELATAWLLDGERSSSKKFDIVRAAEWAIALITRGISTPATSA